MPSAGDLNGADVERVDRLSRFLRHISILLDEGHAGRSSDDGRPAM
jgi:hypothetical protein